MLHNVGFTVARVLVLHYSLLLDVVFVLALFGAAAVFIDGDGAVPLPVKFLFIFCVYFVTLPVLWLLRKARNRTHRALEEAPALMDTIGGNHSG